MNDFARAEGIEWNPGGMSGTVKYGNDRNTLVVFFNKAVENPAKSLAANRRITENQIFIKIQHPGENYNIIERPVKDEDKYRYRDMWQKFLMNRQQIPEGTPIDLLFPNNPAFAENLRGAGVHTIEQCAELSAIAIENVGRGGQECVNRAKQYLASAEKGAGYHQLRKKLDEYETLFRVQNTQIEQLKRQLDSVLLRATQGFAPQAPPNHDAQMARINANHATQGLVPNSAQIPVSTADAGVDAIPSEPIFDVLGVLGNQ